jgi:DNA mismatch repair protein MSH4
MLLRHDERRQDIVGALTRLPDLDKMLSSLNTVPKSPTAKAAQVCIDSLIYLKQVLSLSPHIAGFLRRLLREEEGGSSYDRAHAYQPDELLSAMLEALEHPSFVDLSHLIHGHLTDSTEYKKTQHDMRNQEIFAMRSGKHALLDVARATYQQCVEDIYALGDQYTQMVEAPVKVSYSASRGYYLQLPASLGTSLPDTFVQCVLNRRSISCTTEELCSLSDRTAESSATALLLTHELLQTVMETVRASMQSVYVLVDVVALLDMLCSFAKLASSSPEPYCRPVLTAPTSANAASGPMLISGARHVVLATLQKMKGTGSSSGFVPNECSLSSTECMKIVTGPNGSGKSTYIKQIALIIILAQAGCFVPAHAAMIPIRTRLLSRIGTGDDMEHNLSSFLIEMKETAYILNNVGPGSFVIIDELGRGTSTLDGASIALAVAEELLQRRCYTLFVTHFPQVTALQTMNPAAKNVHLEMSFTDRVSGRGGSEPVRFLHSVGDGACDVHGGYGIKMAELCGFPPEILEKARQLQTKARLVLPRLLAPRTNRTPQLLQTLLSRLLMLQDTTLDDGGVMAYLRGVRSSIPPALVEALDREVETLIETIPQSHSQAAPAPAPVSFSDLGEASQAHSHNTPSLWTRAAKTTAVDDIEMDIDTEELTQPQLPPLGLGLEPGREEKERREEEKRDQDDQVATVNTDTPKSTSAKIYTSTSSQSAFQLAYLAGVAVQATGTIARVADDDGSVSSLSLTSEPSRTPPPTPSLYQPLSTSPAPASAPAPAPAPSPTTTTITITAVSEASIVRTGRRSRDTGATVVGDGPGGACVTYGTKKPKQ